MNSLSWLILIAEWLGNFKVLCGICVGMASAGSLAIGIMGLVNWAEDTGPFPKTNFIISVIITLIFGVLAALVPSKTTVYMIVASEMGEKIMNDPSTKEIVGELKDRIIREMKSDLTRD